MGTLCKFCIHQETSELISEIWTCSSTVTSSWAFGANSNTESNTGSVVFLSI